MDYYTKQGVRGGKFALLLRSGRHQHVVTSRQHLVSRSNQLEE